MLAPRLAATLYGRPTLSVVVGDFVAYLNDLLAIDREGVTWLVNARVQCNAALADDPYVTVLTDADGRSTVGLLGVLNGLFSRAGDMITAAYDEDGMITEFRWVVKGEDDKGDVFEVEEVVQR